MSVSSLNIHKIPMNDPVRGTVAGVKNGVKWRRYRRWHLAVFLKVGVFVFAGAACNADGRGDGVHARRRRPCKSVAVVQ